MIQADIHYLTKEHSYLLINSLKSDKHKALVLLMLDCGCRVSEVISLQFQNFDFKKKLLLVESLKKRGKNIIRKIPISNRLYQSLANYIRKFKNISPTQYLFPSKSAKGHISRQAVFNFLKRKSKTLNIPNLHPHALRHTFATHHLANGTKLEEIKEMLGHSSYDTTLIYASIKSEDLRKRIDKVTTKPKGKITKFIDNFRTERKPKLININFANQFFTVGRNEEIEKIKINLDKGINTVVIGDTGTGKTHLLNCLKSHKKIFRLDDCSNLKKSFVNILLLLFQGDKKHIANLIYKDFSIDKIKPKINRENLSHICSVLIDSCQPKEYVLLIDDITTITPTSRKALEKLKDTFIIIAAARYVKANDASFVWNFEQLKLKNLNRQYSLQMIQSLSSGLEIENPTIFSNHIYEQTNGNPRAIFELIDRYRKEPFLTNEVIKSIKHIGAIKEIDMTFLVVLFFAVLSAMRYMSRELDVPALRFIGALALVLLLVSRPFLMSLKKKYL